MWDRIKVTYFNIVKITVGDGLKVKRVKDDSDPEADINCDSPDIIHVVGVLVGIVRGGNLSRTSGQFSPIHYKLQKSS